MDDYHRSKSYGDNGRMDIETYYPNNNNNSHAVIPYDNGNNNNENYVGKYNGNGFQDMRCYSASYATAPTTQQVPKELKKGKSTNGSSVSSSKGGAAGGAWCFSDPELQRKKRVASYKAYSVEGKIKRSFSKSFRWLKDRISYGSKKF